VRLLDLLLQLRHAARLLKRGKRVPADAVATSRSAAAAKSAVAHAFAVVAAVSAYEDL